MLNILLTTIALTFLAPIGPQYEFGVFKYVQNTDPISDEDRSYVYTSELTPTLLRTANIIWRCTGKGGYNIYVNADDFISTENAYVTIRFDKRDPIVRKWNISTDGDAVFVPDDFLNDFTKYARLASQVVVRITKYNGSNLTLTFSLMGLTKALTRLGCVK